MSADTAALLAAGEKLVELGEDIAQGKVTDAVQAGRDLMAILVAMVPVDELKAFLRPEDRAMADLAADVAEDVKVDAAADKAEDAKARQ